MPDGPHVLLRPLGEGGINNNNNYYYYKAGKKERRCRAGRAASPSFVCVVYVKDTTTT